MRSVTFRTAWITVLLRPHCCDKGMEKTEGKEGEDKEKMGKDEGEGIVWREECGGLLFHLSQIHRID